MFTTFDTPVPNHISITRLWSDQIVRSYYGLHCSTTKYSRENFGSRDLILGMLATCQPKESHISAYCRVTTFHQQ